MHGVESRTMNEFFTSQKRKAAKYGGLLIGDSELSEGISMTSKKAKKSPKKRTRSKGTALSIVEPLRNDNRSGSY
jgi:hypothetical protein